MARRARELLLERQEELAGALLAAAGTAKAHAAAAAAWRAHAIKLRDAHQRRQAQLAADPSKHKKLRALDKELDKRRVRHSEARARAAAARHEHALALEEAAAALQRYYCDDVADILLSAEVGYEAAVSRVSQTAAAGEGALCGAAGAAAAALAAAADALGGGAARRQLLHEHRAFAPPAPPPPPQWPDAEIAALSADALSAADEPQPALVSQCQQYESAAAAARLLCQEAAKTLDAAEAELVRQMEGADVDVLKLFGAGAGAGAVAGAGAADALPDDTPRRDQEDYYLAKVRAYVWCAGRVSRLEARAGASRGAGAIGGGVPRRAARGLFAAPLASERVPAVLSECVRVITAYGLTTQGIFRVCGAHAEVSALRAALERGQAALARSGAADVHAVCTLLKLWLRSLRPPLLPAALVPRLLGARDAPSPALRAALAALPPPHMVALRYLCAFLAHAAAHSHHTRMDAWNLAICVGPALVAAGQVAAQNALNQLLKRLIDQHLELFAQDTLAHTLYTPAAHTPAPLDQPCLYVDDDEEAISEEESFQCDPAPPTTPPTTPPPTARVPPPAPPRRCGSSGGGGGGGHINLNVVGGGVSSGVMGSGGTQHAMDALQSGSRVNTLQLSLTEGPAAVPPLSTPEPPLTPLESPDTPLESPDTSLESPDTPLESVVTPLESPDPSLKPPVTAVESPATPPLHSGACSASQPTFARLAVEAPDLVAGLPADAPAAPPDSPSTSPDAPAAPPDAADTFVYNSDTLKRRPSSDSPAPPPPAGRPPTGH